jgi:hypothetical protein
MFSNWIKFILLFMKTDKFGSKVKMGKYSGDCTKMHLNHLSSELKPICYLLALLAHDFLHVSRIRVKSLTL